MTERYRAVELPRFGAENLTTVERRVPEPGPNEIVVRLTAASVNYRDVVVVDGSYKPDMKLPIVPLSDGCGEVVAVGEAVTRFRGPCRSTRAAGPTARPRPSSARRGRSAGPSTASRAR